LWGGRSELGLPHNSSQGEVKEYKNKKKKKNNRNIKEKKIKIQKNV